MGWIKNTAGKPDSQLTLQIGWNILAMLVVLLVVVLSIYKGRDIGDMVWCFLLGAMGIKGATYVTRRRQSGQGEQGEDLAG